VRAHETWLVLAALAVAAAACNGNDEAASTTTTEPTTTAEPTTTTVVDCEPPVQAAFDPETHQVVEVALICGDGVRDLDLRTVPRVVLADGRPLNAAVTQLLSGATAEETESGYQSVFSSATADGLRSATIEGGVAILDLTAGFERTNNFSTSAASAIVMSQIEATVFQFPNITGLDFRIEGERWCGWENTCDGTPYPLRTRSDHEEERRRAEQAQRAAAERAPSHQGEVETDARGCPTLSPLELSAADEQAVRLITLEKLRDESHEDAEIVRAYPAESPAPEDRVYSTIPIDQCGPGIGSRTWVVEVRLPEYEPSRSLADVQYFVSRFDEGLRIWGSY